MLGFKRLLDPSNQTYLVSIELGSVNCIPPYEQTVMKEIESINDEKMEGCFIYVVTSEGPAKFTAGLTGKEYNV